VLQFIDADPAAAGGGQSLERKEPSPMKYPTAVLGLVVGPLRFESCGGADLFDQSKSTHVLVNKEPFLADDPADGVNKPFAVTHLQKKSRFGFLIMSHEEWWQLCFHVWFTFRFQQTRVGDGGAVVAIPGSERVLYWRVGWSRWDAGDCKYMVEKIGFGTWYGPGLHWD
jgi:hypothetical protein